jgi:hypothetical protein
MQAISAAVSVDRSGTPSSSLLPDHHIFVASKAAWDEIGDGLQQFERYAT